jgi:hypothetical protein
VVQRNSTGNITKRATFRAPSVGIVLVIIIIIIIIIIVIAIVQVPLFWFLKTEFLELND